MRERASVTGCPLKVPIAAFKLATPFARGWLAATHDMNCSSAAMMPLPAGVVSVANATPLRRMVLSIRAGGGGAYEADAVAVREGEMPTAGEPDADRVAVRVPVAERVTVMVELTVANVDFVVVGVLDGKLGAAVMVGVPVGEDPGDSV